jgi:hypothetical protein
MHRIEETPYGYRVTFEGFLQRNDAGTLLDSMRSKVRPREGGFSVLVDMRSSRAFPFEAQEAVKQAILHCKEVGLERNAVVLNGAIAALQARRLARETGIEAYIRYIDAASEPEWERVAVDWLKDGIDPDAN